MAELKKYLVHVDVTFSGDIEVESYSKESARNEVLGMQFVPSDIRSFYHFGTDIVDVSEVEEAEV